MQSSDSITTTLEIFKLIHSSDFVPQLGEVLMTIFDFLFLKRLLTKKL